MKRHEHDVAISETVAVDRCVADLTWTRCVPEVHGGEAFRQRCGCGWARVIQRGAPPLPVEVSRWESLGSWVHALPMLAEVYRARRASLRTRGATPNGSTTT